MASQNDTILNGSNVQSNQHKIEEIIPKNEKYCKIAKELTSYERELINTQANEVLTAVRSAKHNPKKLRLEVLISIQHLKDKKGFQVSFFQQQLLFLRYMLKQMLSIKDWFSSKLLPQRQQLILMIENKKGIQHLLYNLSQLVFQLFYLMEDMYYQEQILPKFQLQSTLKQISNRQFMQQVFHQNIQY
ncbi:unnamed protein product [Paramecium sonneborni]|uniref:Uncharacterized protein n=1 Tax=Paramecium sonneborni TaxID=65129 RepID=A0A8S1RF13_9CILI|nr:unnamed protein product [Paramecium sonneborni]